MDLSKAFLEQELQSVRNQGLQARANISVLEEQLAKQRSDVEQTKGAEKALLMMLQRVSEPEGAGQQTATTATEETVS